MKKSIYIFFLGAAFGLSSCNENDKNDGRFDSAKTSSGWVQFSDDFCVGVVYEANSQINIPVEMHVPVNKEGTEVYYSITDTNGSSTAIIPERTGSVTITSDDQIGGGATERIMLKDLVLNLTDAGLAQTAEFDVTLTSTSKQEVTVGLSDNTKPVVVHVIVRGFGGASYTYAGSAAASIGFMGPDFTQVLTPVEGNPRQFTTASAWGVQFIPELVGNPAAIRNYPAIITITDQKNSEGKYKVHVEGINDPASPSRYPGGTDSFDTYDACNDVFSIRLRQGVFPTNPFTVDVTYSPVPAE
ncbi:hypothetical protein HYN48_00710 [Flavobacterium magnum]|uniref:Uncharacterized protein n=1 Tax=Flavobacterium magnum TaxID=2162713 RepID=A0A2S0RB08_9FLAO|nr:lipoprotein [Flavobacterium magnum]AWA28725.1 hypothetical protein HYN48_00710 [Flavobacterium magnum]